MDELDFQLEAGNPNTKIHFGVKIKLFLCRFTVRYKVQTSPMHLICSGLVSILCLLFHAAYLLLAFYQEICLGPLPMLHFNPCSSPKIGR